MRVFKSRLLIAIVNRLNQVQLLIQSQNLIFIQQNQYSHKILKGKLFQALKRTKWIRVVQVLLK
jgi:hypothetical protein